MGAAGFRTWTSRRLRQSKRGEVARLPSTGVAGSHSGSCTSGRRSPSGGREGRSPLLSFRPTVSFPAVAGRPNAQTTRTTPSVGRRWRPTSVHLDFHLLPSGFPAKTHTPLHSSLYLQTRNGEIGQRERARSLSGRSTASLAVSRSEERKREGRASGGEEDIRNSMMYKLRCIVQII